MDCDAALGLGVAASGIRKEDGFEGSRSNDFMGYKS